MAVSDSFFIDLHVHATQSREQSDMKMTIDSLMNVENIVKKAQELGLHTVGIMEHVEPICGRHPWSEALHVKKLVEKLKNQVDFKILSGCEASIIDLEGNLSASIEGLKDANFDYVIASIHSSFPTIPKSINEYHSLIIEMMKNSIKLNPYIDIIGHPWRDSPKILKRLGINAPWSFDLIPEKDIIELAQTAKHAKVSLEISRPAMGMPAYSYFLSIAAKAGGLFSIGSDAHQWDRFTLISQNEIKLLKNLGVNSNNLRVW